MSSERNDNDVILFSWFRNLFKKKRIVEVGDLGVYHDICGYIPLGSTRNIHYDVYIKVEAIEVYENLVEVKVLDTKIHESEDMCNFIKHDNIKYLKPSDVQWKLKPTKTK